MAKAQPFLSEATYVPVSKRAGSRLQKLPRQVRTRRGNKSPHSPTFGVSMRTN